MEQASKQAVLSHRDVGLIQQCYVCGAAAGYAVPTVAVLYADANQARHLRTYDILMREQVCVCGGAHTRIGVHMVAHAWRWATRMAGIEWCDNPSGIGIYHPNWSCDVHSH